MRGASAQPGAAPHGTASSRLPLATRPGPVPAASAAFGAAAAGRVRCVGRWHRRIGSLNLSVTCRAAGHSPPPASGADRGNPQKGARFGLGPRRPRVRLGGGPSQRGSGGGIPSAGWSGIGPWWGVQRFVLAKACLPAEVHVFHIIAEVKCSLLNVFMKIGSQAKRDPSAGERPQGECSCIRH